MPKRLIYGYGINDVTYQVVLTEKVDGKCIQKWVCPYYIKWKAMIRRCYDKNHIKKNPNYEQCNVHPDWLNLSNFIKWVDNQPNKNWFNCELDKDILFTGNKEYSPEKCVFITHQTNSFVLDSGKIRGDYLIGVVFNKPMGKYQARCSNPFTGKKEHLGYFTCETQAHLAWKKRKQELATILATHQEDKRVADALMLRYL